MSLQGDNVLAHTQEASAVVPRSHCLLDDQDLACQHDLPLLFQVHVLGILNGMHSVFMQRFMYMLS